YPLPFAPAAAPYSVLSGRNADALLRPQPPQPGSVRRHLLPANVKKITIGCPVSVPGSQFAYKLGDNLLPSHPGEARGHFGHVDHHVAGVAPGKEPGIPPHLVAVGGKPG